MLSNWDGYICIVKMYVRPNILKPYDFHCVEVYALYITIMFTWWTYSALNPFTEVSIVFIFLWCGLCNFNYFYTIYKNNTFTKYSLDLKYHRRVVFHSVYNFSFFKLEPQWHYLPYSCWCIKYILGFYTISDLTKNLTFKTSY